MKTPISYYGGKQRLLPELLKLVPEHTQYVEPFIGGASLFFAKPPSQHECINDYDLRVANFWFCLKNHFPELQRLIQNTLHHEAEHRRAKQILQQGLITEEGVTNVINFAWAFWVQTIMSFSNKLFAGFAFSDYRGQSKTTGNFREQLNQLVYERIRYTEIFNRDAIELIKLKDGADTFFYFDPPYAESNCGHYEDKKEVYYRLLDVLPSLKSKWILSSYPSEQLSELRLKYGWNTKDMDMNLSVSGKHNQGKRKTECLTWNYNIKNKLFDF